MTPEEVVENLSYRIKQIDELLENLTRSEKRRFKSRFLKEQKTLVACKKIVEKQLPKKPIPDNRHLDKGKCPSCKAVLLHKSTKYCGNCGQALDWSDEE